ncbi:Pimeloyl-ACP methyl ester carboxylesterase [Jatrophihabitans endophyticus]|uniref:Pimeloyl-ACP methyl ester carboxylesterase n=1 Tax=Jatrophihabitans endophyticus TaxID=1206085 RepID=A0A1M5D8K0_9ACTN|nr:alpha/beta hydrolase [Jatrophihabitans endophyticus]SHF63217.1 Pimeloyl-ACP methyl ester carboxylesterase [Jatrophihabitans endophyticus]
MSTSLPAAVPTVRSRDAVPGVHYVVTGEGTRTVVLLHGFADNLTTWSRLVGPLAVDARVVAIDLPGFGRSERGFPTPLLDGYADVVRNVLDAEGVDWPVALVGNSMGAAVATVFADRFPDRTDRVVLIDMPGLRGVPRLWRMALSRPVEFGMRATLGAVGHRSAAWTLGAAYRVVAAADPRRIDLLAREGFATPYSRRGSVPDLLPIGRALLTDLAAAGLADVVGELRAPALVVFGSRDILTPSRVLRRIGREGGAVVIPGCGHCPQLDQPALLLEHIGPFLHATAAEQGEPEHAATA